MTRPVKRIGRGDTTSAIYKAEAVELLNARAESRALSDMIFMDPPFNQDVHYPGSKRDKMPPREYGAWLLRLCRAAMRSTRESGIVVVHLPDEWIGTVAEWAYAEQRCKSLRVVNWLVWRYGFGQCPTGAFVRMMPTKAHALILSPGGPKMRPWTYTAAGLVPSDRGTKYRDNRTNRRAASSVVPPGMRPVGDVIELPRVTGNSRERRPLHPNQLPERYLGSLIATFTNPGDLVGDPFCGSGTTATVARALRRRSWTGDISSEVLASAETRIRDGVVDERVLTIGGQNDRGSPCESNGHTSQSGSSGSSRARRGSSRSGSGS